MSSQGFRRGYKTPKGYNHDPGGRIGLYNQTYLGYVKDNNDEMKMGRLKVWIPEFAADGDDKTKWITVSYCSPFAGATSVKNNVKSGTGMGDTQKSYGWWAVPPDLDNVVIVMFINGDPNKGIWIGSMYQQFMNHMVPGIPSGPSHQEAEEGNPPVAEYNRWDPGVTNSDNKTAARYDPLHEALTAQGLYSDTDRGPSTAGARRDGVSNAYGFLSPGGSQFVFDDAEESKSIRIRTANGTQVLINDSIGFVYIVSGNGNSWLEVSDDGIDAYSAKSISMRAQGDLNFHADGSVNIHAGGGLNMYGSTGTSLQTGGGFDLLSGADFNIAASGTLNLKPTGPLNASSGGEVSISSGGALALSGGGEVGLSASGKLFLSGSQVVNNGGKGPKAKAAGEASAPKPGEHPDNAIDGSGSEVSTKSISKRLPGHEPWSGHPGSKSAPARKGLTAGQTAAVYEGSGDEVDEVADQPVPPDDGKKFCYPCYGQGNSPFGMRLHPVTKQNQFHGGVDIRSGHKKVPIYASKGGKVIQAGRRGSAGNMITIDHGNGVKTIYMHLDSIKVKVNQTVEQMEQIGNMGTTGRSTGIHLHFEIHVNGKKVNPATYIPWKMGKFVNAGAQK